ncbi:MAG: DUF1295 domain-containing protein [Acidimicrobiales bacterium]
MSPLHLVLYLAGGFAVLTWVLSVLTRDTSWVDRLWSILPASYVVVFAADARLADPRLDVMAALAVAWGARLTYNLARKGGYRVEDYRWSVLRSEMSPRRFAVFNLLFVALGQNVQLVLLALPAETAYLHRSAPYDVTDGVLAGLFLAALVGETIADQQQWDFQRWKTRVAARGDTPDPGFCTTGLFRYSRHPNYFFEIAQWWVLFLLGASAARSLGQWTVVGAATLTVLFVGSTRFTERLTSAKYPAYAAYQRRTSPVIPWWPRREVAGGDEATDAG